MSDTNPLSNDPAAEHKLQEEKRAQWDKITAKRMEMIEAEKKKSRDREALEKSRAAGEHAAFAQEIIDTKERHDQREEWRQGQHEKKREEEKKRKEIEAQALAAAEEKKKHDAEEAERQTYLSNLHKMAVAHKIRDKRLAADDQMAEEIKNAMHSAERQMKQLTEETERALHHLDADKQKHIAQVHYDIDRRKKMLDAKKIPPSERNREILSLDEEMQNRLFTIDLESKRLKDEMIRHADAKKHAIERQETAKKQEAQRRKDTFEKWVQEG